MNRIHRLHLSTLVALIAGCAQTQHSQSTNHAASPAPSNNRLVGIIQGSDNRPAPGTIVVIAHDLDGTIYYSGGTAVEPVERRAVDLPGAFVPKGTTVARTITNEKGEYRFEGLAEGCYSLVAVHPQHGSYLGFKMVGSNGELTLRLNPITTLEAKIDGLNFDPKWHYVNLEADSPIMNLALELRMEQKDTTTIFTTSPVPDQHAWYLVVWGRNASRSFTVPLMKKHLGELKPGKLNKVAIDLASGDALDGRVTDKDGKPMPDVAVIARPKSNPIEACAAFTNADGRYRIVGLASGPHKLEAVRHQLRSEIGCGEGPYDVATSKEISLPLASASDADFQIDALVPQLKTGDMAPQFGGTTVDGPTIYLKDYHGKVVLLDFWATWCRTCLADLKYIAALQKELAPQNNFAVISISLDKDPHAVSRFLERQKMPWPQIVGGPADRNLIARTYNVTSTPTTILIDRNGKVAAQHIPGESLRAEVMKLLK
ncbi:MAG: carboxypeptidase regulatory-like domain-containing protein [Planctomycetes bacterium]|nr:carboxypeptidase regulatory-like domain-containing protein [Planctomycetota bacterium]